MKFSSYLLCSCCIKWTPRVLQAQKRAYFVAQEAVRREDESKRVSRINEEGEEEYWEQVDAIDNVSTE